MPLSSKMTTLHATHFQVDNTYESSKDVTHWGVIVDIMIYSTASKVKPISMFSRELSHSTNSLTW